MATVTAHTWTNITLPPAPGEYFLPNSAGVAVPPNATSWALNIDQANVPADQIYEFEMWFQRLAQWTDKAGGVHAAGEWLLDFGGVLSGGPMPKGGTVNHITSTIGATGPNGTMIEPYPDNARIRVKQMQAWLFPTISLTVT